MIRVGLVGLGKMGLSHYAIANAHPSVRVEAVCDSTSLLSGALEKYTGVPSYTDLEAMLRDVALDALIIATPTRLHSEMIRTALDCSLHVFCEKPFCLNLEEGHEAAMIAEAKNLVNQVGYHCRFLGPFQEMKRLIDSGAIGATTHLLAEAYGPVILRPKGSTWRTKRADGGGCLYDYAAHPINLLNWFLGPTERAGGAALHGVFSDGTDDQVLATLFFASGQTAQLSVNWSDASCRKMIIKISAWGTGGRLYADRSECHAYLRGTTGLPEGYRQGWNVRYATELTSPVWFYVRGEEYSAQLDYFFRCIETGRPGNNVNSFESAWMTDRAMAMIIDDVTAGGTKHRGPAHAKSNKLRGLFGSR